MGHLPMNHRIAGRGLCLVQTSVAVILHRHLLVGATVVSKVWFTSALEPNVKRTAVSAT